MFRRPLAIALTSCLLVALAACGDDDDDGATASPTGDAAAEGDAGGTGELVVATGEDAYVTEEPEADVGFMPRAIVEGLVQMTPDYEIEPVLATGWELIEPNTWRFELREGVTFHDGQPFTAEAVKYTFDRIAEAGGGNLKLGPDSTVVVDDQTVEVTPTVENRRLVEQLVHPDRGIIAPGSLPGEEPVGTGPFQFVSYAPQEELVVERYDGYWGDPAGVEQITFRFIPEANARRLALEAGDVDVMLDVPLDAVSSVEGSGFTVDVPEPGLYEAMYANIGGADGYTILQDLDVRRAVGLAIDREALVEGLLNGLAVEEQTVVPARLLGDAAEVIDGFETDLDEAGALLDGAGWAMGDGGVREKDGQPLRLELVNGFPSAEEHGDIAEFVQAQLGEVGIEVDIIVASDTGAYEERLDAAQGDLWLERGNQNDANPAFLPALLFWEEGLFGNLGYQPLFAPGWPPEDPEPRIGDGSFDETVVEALAAETNEEVKELTAEAMHLLIDEHAIVIPLAGLVRPLAYRDGVEGLTAHPSGIQIRFDGISLPEG